MRRAAAAAVASLLPTAAPGEVRAAAAAVTASPSLPESWQERRAALAAGHPLFRRTLRGADLQELPGLLRAAAGLPGTEWLSVAYLVQGEEDIADKEPAMWSNHSDVFLLTFRTQRRDAVFFPQSRLAEGRNALLLAALLQEVRMGRRYTYYALLDADAEAAPPWPLAVPLFEAFLRDWAPAVGVPTARSAHEHRVGGFGGDGSPRAIWHFDHIFVAVHREASDALLPYEASLDESCAWVSQWSFSLLASALYRDHVLVLPQVWVGNPVHSSYPKEDCMVHLAAASARLRARSPQSAASCFPDPPAPGVVRLPAAGAAGGGGVLSASSYLPWGVARRRPPAGYAGADLATLASCDGEAAVHALSAPVANWSPWCRGCSPSEAFWMLQVMVASRPFLPSNWNAMGTWMVLISQYPSLSGAPAVESFRVAHLRLAALCFGMSWRLLRLTGAAPSPAVDENLAASVGALAAAGEDPGPWDGDTLTRAVAQMMRQQSDSAVDLLDAGTLGRLVRDLLAGGPDEVPFPQTSGPRTSPGPSRTAFCLSGNIREGHRAHAARRLRQQLDRLDPGGTIFAYVNPCPAQTQPWWWHLDWAAHKTQGREWVAPGCPDPWANSSFLRLVRPHVLHIYNETDVAPPTRNCPLDVPEVTWGPGVYQGLIGVNRCFEMVRAWEQRHGAFDWIVRARPDQCRDEEYCEQMSYCRLDAVSPDTVHAHRHSDTKPAYWDNFAAVPRRYADAYFTAVLDFNECRGMEAYQRNASVMYGEDILSSHVTWGREPPVPFADDCGCHRQPTCMCPRGRPRSEVCRW